MLLGISRASFRAVYGNQAAESRAWQGTWSPEECNRVQSAQLMWPFAQSKLTILAAQHRKLAMEALVKDQIANIYDMDGVPRTVLVNVAGNVIKIFYLAITNFLKLLTGDSELSLLHPSYKYI